MDEQTLKKGILAWMEAKEAERVAVEKRRTIEDFLTAKVLELSQDFEGTKTLKVENLTLKATGRLTRKVDDQKLEELARDAGLTEVINVLFTYKPALNLREWKNATPDVVSALSEAITTIPGRVSYSVEIKEAK